jgi:hypothetical protein
MHAQVPVRVQVQYKYGYLLFRTRVVSYSLYEYLYCTRTVLVLVTRTVKSHDLRCTKARFRVQHVDSFHFIVIGLIDWILSPSHVYNRFTIYHQLSTHVVQPKSFNPSRSTQSYTVYHICTRYYSYEY